MRIEALLAVLRKETAGFLLPLSDHVIAEFGNDPFLILISCLLSLRARDLATIPLCSALFKRVKTPQEFLDLPIPELEKLIFIIGF